jgi:hypothetical protein
MKAHRHGGKSIAVPSLLTLICTLLMTVPRLANTAEPRANTTELKYFIPFADHGGISDWRADGTKGLWIRSINGSWYYATFMGVCSQLPFIADRLRFIAEPGGELDRWSSIQLAHGGRCYFNSFQASDGPPKQHKAVK